MSGRSPEVKVGLTVMVAFILLVAGTAWLAKVRLDRGGYEIAAVFNDAGGVSKGDPVMVAGVEMGRVTTVELHGREVRVGLWLPEAVRLPQDSRIELESVGLMGEKSVAIRPGASAMLLEPGGVLVGEYRGGVAAIAAQASSLLSSLDSLAVKLDETVLGEGSGIPESGAPAGARALMGDATRAARELYQTVAENRADLRASVENLRVVSTEARGVMEGRRAELEEAITRLTRSARSLEEAAERLATASTPFIEAGRSIQAGEGTLGKLVREDSLYCEVMKTTRAVDSLVSEIRENPRRFLKVSLF